MQNLSSLQQWIRKLDRIVNLELTDIENFNFMITNHNQAIQEARHHVQGTSSKSIRSKTTTTDIGGKNMQKQIPNELRMSRWASRWGWLDDGFNHAKGETTCWECRKRNLQGSLTKVITSRFQVPSFMAMSRCVEQSFLSRRRAFSGDGCFAEYEFSVFSQPVCWASTSKPSDGARGRLKS